MKRSPQSTLLVTMLGPVCAMGAACKFFLTMTSHRLITLGLLWLSDKGTVQTVKASDPAGVNRRFVRLKVTK